MTILIANIGTSDLLIKVGDYWLPIGFDRNEPNVDERVLTEEPEKERAWKERQGLIINFLEEQSSTLDLKDIIRQKGKFKTYHFKNLTYQLQKFSKDYPNQYPENLQLKVGRLSGIVKTAYEKFKVRQVYLFVTNQPRTEDEVEHQDTIYLFELLKKLLEEKCKYWQKSENIDQQLMIEKVTIPRHIPAVDQDKLLKEYYKFFNTIDSQEEILISIKGGTPQMQTALRIQAIASNIQKQIFLEPKLVVKDLLDGEASECQTNCYWQYMRNQKYATIKLLLNQRWDFDGAREILKDWQETLKYLTEKVPDIASDAEKEQEKLASILKQLDRAVGCFNLDKHTLQDDEKIEHNFWLNVYTQCRIYWELDEVANFLIRLSSYYEVTLNELIAGLDGEKYLKNNNQKKDWVFVRGKEDEDYKMCNKFEELEQDFGAYEVTWKPSRKIPKKYKLIVKGQFGQGDNSAIAELKKSLKSDFYRQKEYKLRNRYSKRNLVQALIDIDHPASSDLWTQTLTSLQRLDYWVDKRNDLIHSARGVSKQTMIEQWEEDKQNWTEEDEKNKYKANPKETCHPNNILGEVNNICTYTYKLLGQEPPPYAKSPYSDTTPYYLYTQLRDEICQQLI